jgi:DNA polymerase
MEFSAAHNSLAWQIELGATEAITDAPINRYEVPATLLKAKTQAKVKEAPSTAIPTAVDPIALARSAASGASSLEELALALAAYDHCTLKQGARNLVFSDGVPGARVMVIGEAPGRDEDVQGKPFVGRAGQLLDRMFDAIGMGRAQDNPIYITNILPWRPPQNRDPSPEEVAMMMPFVEKHVSLAKPEILVLMGNIPCQAVLGQKGITRLRGAWTTAMDRPALPMFHPAYLLRQPHLKREAWADLLTLQAKLRDIS